MKKSQEEIEADGQKLLDAVDGHIRQKGYAAIQVSDGEYFFFSENTLEKLLLRARDNPQKQVSVFVPLRRA